MKPFSLDHERAQVIAEIREACPGQTLTYGIDRKGCYARIGDLEGRATDVTSALRDALAKAKVRV